MRRAGADARKLLVMGSGCVAAIAVALLIARPAVVERWSIYASATGTARDPYTLFLGPFPTQFSCTVEARVIVRSGGHATCRPRLAIELGHREQDLLWSEFWPSARWIALCQAQLHTRPPREPAGPQVRPAALRTRRDAVVAAHS